MQKLQSYAYLNFTHTTTFSYLIYYNNWAIGLHRVAFWYAILQRLYKI